MSPEVFPILLNLSIAIPLGLNPLLLLTIDLMTELAPAISLAYETPENDIMDTSSNSELYYIHDIDRYKSKVPAK
jgi:sodium/potassium-transporting ATPase subunit alpha